MILRGMHALEIERMARSLRGRAQLSEWQLDRLALYLEAICRGRPSHHDPS